MVRVHISVLHVLHLQEQSSFYQINCVLLLKSTKPQDLDQILCQLLQGRSDKNGKKKQEAAAAAQEERDKPYACDSE